MTKLIVAITRGLVRDQHTRRMAMFVVLLVALVMLFAGATFLNHLLLETPWIFLCYWVACAWLTFTALVMAVFDLLIIRIAAARDRQRLKAEIFGQEKENRDS